MSIRINSLSGVLNITPNVFKTLPKSTDVPTNNESFVTKSFVDSNYMSQINQVDLNDYSSYLDPDSKDLYIDLSSNTLNYLTNNIDGFFYSPLTYLNGMVRALVFDLSGNLYAGGYFTQAGEKIVNYIAKWDGTEWSSLGRGLSGEVEALVFDLSGNLYAGGWFRVADGTNSDQNTLLVHNIAKWDGTVWSSLRLGLGGGVSALAVDSSNNLYAGGTFTGSYSGVALTNIAKWDGTVWSSLGQGLGYYIINSDANLSTNRVLALAFDLSGNLYAGGNFKERLDTSGNVIATNKIAKWDGTEWSSLDQGLNHYVNVIAVDSNNILYVGGRFSAPISSPTTEMRRIAKWDGTVWSSLDLAGGFAGGGNHQVYALAFDSDGDLYVGGEFYITENNIQYYLSIAKWNVSSSVWSTVGNKYVPGVHVFALVIDSSGNLYAGTNQINISTNPTNPINKISFTTNANVYVNNKYLYNLSRDNTINVSVTNNGIAYTNGFVI